MRNQSFLKYASIQKWWQKILQFQNLIETRLVSSLDSRPPLIQQDHKAKITNLNLTNFDVSFKPSMGLQNTMTWLFHTRIWWLNKQFKCDYCKCTDCLVPKTCVYFKLFLECKQFTQYLGKGSLKGNILQNIFVVFKKRSKCAYTFPK